MAFFFKKKNNPEVEKKRPPRRKSRLITKGDVAVIGRVLTFARPYRTQIILSLAVGVLAGALTAINLLALIPVLEILFEERDQDKLAGVQEDIDEARAKLDEADHFWEEIDPWMEKKKAEFRYQWNMWIIRHQERAIYILAGLLVGAQILRCLLLFYSKYTMQKSFYLAVVRMRNTLYGKCLTLDLPDLDRLTSGDLIARMNNDMRSVRQVFSQFLSNIVLQPFTILFILLTMLFLNWQMTLIAVVGIPVIVAPISYLGKRLRTMGRKDEEEDARILSYSQEVIQGLMIVKAFTGEKRELKKFRELAREVARRQIRREKYRLYSEPFVEITASLAMAGVLCAGAYTIIKSDNAGMNPAEFLVYLALMTRFYPPMKRLSNTFIKTQKSLASAERIFEILDMEPAVKEKPDAIDLLEINEKIEFDGVTFSYRKELPPALREFTLEVPKGRKIALVGRTGAGKSTVARLLPRFYDVNEGSIRIDGHDIRDVTTKSLRQLMAAVSQETILFNDTVLNNIRYGRPEASREDVEEAARAAYAHEFVEYLPQGYETIVGERGNHLSGGQRQRLAIARALLANTPILILDEATSALDNESEAIVQAAIERLMENRTVIVIAHRLSTVRKADEILVLENGRLVERGNFEELSKRRGKFFDLLRGHEFSELDEHGPFYVPLGSDT